jgi:hypothetical protein
MNYLIDKIIIQWNEGNFLDIYNFIRDRGRAIRKDFKVQNHLKGAECIQVLECLSRYLIYCDYELCELPESKFSRQQSRFQIVDTLTSLMEAYDNERNYQKQNPESSPSCLPIFQNESEYRSYFIYVNINSPLKHFNFNLDKENLFIKNALEIHSLIESSQYLEFFQKIRNASFMIFCCLHHYFIEFRKNVLISQKSPLPITDVCSNLLFNSNTEAIEFCKYWGLSVIKENGVNILKPNNSQLLGIIQSYFRASCSC